MSEFEWDSANLVFATLAEPEPAAMYFTAGDKVILRLEPNGDIYVNGRLAENDKEVVEGMRQFLNNYGLGGPKNAKDTI